MKWYTLLPALIMIVFDTAAENVTFGNDFTYKNYLKISGGAASLVFEFYTIPMLDGEFNWRKSMKWDNPFKYVMEKEPYHEDEMWHFVGSSTFCELNYRIFHDLIGIEDPLITTAVTTFAFWTGMECVDALIGSGFSINDELGNTLGTAFGILHIIKPSFPVYVRLGVSDWSELMRTTSKGNQSRFIGHMYDFMKVDMIYMFPQHLYTGLSLSRKEKVKKDRLGLTLGYDFVKTISQRTDGWWKEPLDFISNHVNTSLSFTMWMK